MVWGDEEDVLYEQYDHCGSLWLVHLHQSWRLGCCRDVSIAMAPELYKHRRMHFELSGWCQLPMFLGWPWLHGCCNVHYSPQWPQQAAFLYEWQHHLYIQQEAYGLTCTCEVGKWRAQAEICMIGEEVQCNQAQTYIHLCRFCALSTDFLYKRCA